jgi:16S rRNA (cytidine1402-2'-O)-methyltransferase
VREALQNQIEIECLPGPTAFVPALVKSGFPTDKFVFEGFLPHKKGKQTRLKFLAEETRTIILYESPHRIIKTLQGLAEFMGEDRLASVSRELTKLYEETQTNTLGELITYFQNQKIRGEFVIVIKGKEE